MNSAFKTIDKNTTWIEGDLDDSFKITLIIWRMGKQCYVEAFTQEIDAHDRYSVLEAENITDAILFIGPNVVK